MDNLAYTHLVEAHEKDVAPQGNTAKRDYESSFMSSYAQVLDDETPPETTQQAAQEKS